ncbi:FAD-dependent oxidoreductase [Jiangella endophytica]|uniref:FAD-dependent oxidoreductase n=1 Tax=Jiangella endophytica TaxID=1623398 RepID=UPI000E351DB6|nr:FAD-dependent oxidoreductase [Jiangella endophytica]
MDLETDVLVVGGGLGGVAAALAALRLGRRVVLTEESPWLGGQLTSQAVPPDENAWVETFGAPASYRRLRAEIRDHYRRHYPLTESARAAAALNPGDGRVSPLCHEPKAALAAIQATLAPYLANRRLTVLTGTRPRFVETGGDVVTAVRFEATGGDAGDVTVRAPYVLDATELGDVVEKSGTESVIGAESRDQTGELHALPGPPQPLDQQSFTWCFALDYREGENWTIDRPAGYGFWRDHAPDYWPGPLLSWTDVRPDSLAVRTHPLFTDAATPTGGHGIDRWTFRRLLSVRTFTPGFLASDVTLVNWPQNDYVLGPLVGVGPAERQRHLDAAMQLSRSLLYWMQTEAPRHDGGTGYPGLRPRGDLLRDGVPDDAGLALRPYVRESRRIAGEVTVVEEHVGVEARRTAGLPPGSEVFPDSVGIGCYRIDLHPSTGAGTPRSYVDIACHPFQVPLGALLPVRMENLIAAAKNIATTHVTNGGYRLHPVEWTIGEAAGALAAHCLETGLPPRAVRAKPVALERFQRLLTGVLGAELAWPERVRTSTV